MESPSLVSWILLLAAAFAGGAANALAGGGTFFIFPALIFAGVPPIPANATSCLVTAPGGMVSASIFLRGQKQPVPYLIRLVATSIAGSTLGSLLLLSTPSARFARMVPFLILAAALVFTLSTQLRRAAAAHRATHPAAMFAGQFLIGIYGGYFGAGMGVVMIVLFLITARLDVQDSAALRLWCGTGVNFLALLIFALKGIVLWRLGAPMLLAAISGGWAGARVVQKLNVEAVRRAVLIYAWGTGLWLLVR